MAFMKNFKWLVILIVLIHATSSHVAAQTGYVVTTKGDTIRGKIKYLSFGISRNVQVTDEKKKKTVYSILQTKSFSMNDEVYHPVRTSAGYDYMKILKNGYLSLYAYQLANQNTWDGRFLLKKDGSSMDVPNIGFKKIIVKFLNDCPEIEAGFESKEFSKTKLNEIVDQYNACIQANTLKQLEARSANIERAEKTNTWVDLETAIKNGNEFEGRADALDMIAEIKSKITKGEKVPKFLSDGLKALLKDQTKHAELLNKALSEIQ